MLSTREKTNMALYAVIILCYIIGAAFINAFTIIGFLLTVYTILSGRRQQVVETMLILSSFAGIMKYNSPFSLYNILFIVSIIRILLIDKGKVNRQLVLFFLATMIVSTFGILFAGVDSVKETISFVAGILFAGITISDTREFDIKAIVRVFSLGVIASSLVFSIMQYLPGIANYISYSTYRVGANVRQIRYSGLINNANHYTLSINVICMALLSYLVTKKTKIIDIIFLVILVLCGIYSLSKSFFFALLVSILISIVYLLRYKPIRWVQIIAVGFVIGLIVLQFVNIKYFEILFNRVLVENTADINLYTSGRISIFKIYMKYFYENLRVLFVGNGLFNPLERESHSFFIETIYSIGLIGTFFIVAAYLSLCRFGLKKRKPGNRSILNYSLLIVFFVRGLAVNIIQSIMFPAYLIIITLFIGENFTETRESRVY